MSCVHQNTGKLKVHSILSCRKENKIILLSLFVFITSMALAQSSNEGKVHAAFLYAIVKYFEWPNNSEAGEFEIAVLGANDVFDALKANFEGKVVGNKKCVIRNITSASDLAPNSVVYIGKSKSKEFDVIKRMAGNKSLLTVTEKEDLGSKGSCVNFIVVEGKLRFELNRSATAISNLKVSGALVSMAILL